MKFEYWAGSTTYDAKEILDAKNEYIKKGVYSADKMVATFNARSLFNFFHHRCCSRAQWEIQALANEMLKLVREVAPTVFKNAGPACISGPCPEGAMSCGKRKEMIEFYNNL